MPFEYKTDTVDSQRELEEAINQWAKKGYEPHTIGVISKPSIFPGDSPRQVTLLIVRKIIRKPRKKS